jgi:hypothetical protein
VTAEWKATVKYRRWLVWHTAGTAYASTWESALSAAAAIGKTVPGRDPKLDIQVERVEGGWRDG